MSHFTFRDISEALPELMEFVLGGAESGSRNGATKERTMIHVNLEEPWRREILHPLRRASLPAQIAETVWVLSGRDDVKWLSHYLPRAKDFSDDGKVWRGAYGPRLRAWGGQHQPTTSDGFAAEPVDQLAHVVELLRKDPATRRAVMTIYDPRVDTAPGKDIPCNNWIHFLSRMGKLDAHVAIRSNDLMWGWSGINAFEWSTLLEVVAVMTGLQMGQLHFSISSLHLYGQHWAKAERIAAIKNAELVQPALPSPRFGAGVEDYWQRTASVGTLDCLLREWFQTEGELRTRPQDVERNLRRVEISTDPMLRSWLQVLGWWWSSDERYLDPLLGTPLYVAAVKSPGKPGPVVGTAATDDSRKHADAQPLPGMPADPGLGAHLATLHAEKHAAYGDSWKKRGELLSILPNIARKVDRLEGGKATSDEAQLDTAGDLLVYLVKYRFWLYSVERASWPEGVPVVKVAGDPEPQRVRSYLEHMDAQAGADSGRKLSSPDVYRQLLVEDFNELANIVEGDKASTRGKARIAERAKLVEEMAWIAYTLAWLLRQEAAQVASEKAAWQEANATRPWKGYEEQ